MKIPCKLGFHKWELWEGINTYCGHNVEEALFRKCSCCGMVQQYYGPDDPILGNWATPLLDYELREFVRVIK